MVGNGDARQPNCVLLQLSGQASAKRKEMGKGKIVERWSKSACRTPILMIKIIEWAMDAHVNIQSVSLHDENHAVALKLVTHLCRKFGSANEMQKVRWLEGKM